MDLLPKFRQKKCMEMGFKKVQQCIIFDMLFHAEDWADKIMIDGVCFYWVARQKMCSEMPMLGLKEKTVYRYYKDLHDLGVIEYRKGGTGNAFDCIRITEFGKNYAYGGNKNSCEAGIKIPTDGNKNSAYLKSKESKSKESKKDKESELKSSEPTQSKNDTIEVLESKTGIKNIFDTFSVLRKKVEGLSEPPAYIPSKVKDKSKYCKWLSEIDKLLTIDKYSVDEIIKVITYACNSFTWSKNLQSILKLRRPDRDGIKHYERFKSEMKSDKGKVSNYNDEDIATYDRNGKRHGYYGGADVI